MKIAKDSLVLNIVHPHFLLKLAAIPKSITNSWKSKYYLSLVFSPTNHWATVVVSSTHTQTRTKQKDKYQCQYFPHFSSSQNRLKWRTIYCAFLCNKKTMFWLRWILLVIFPAKFPKYMDGNVSHGFRKIILDIFLVKLFRFSFNNGSMLRATKKWYVVILFDIISNSRSAEIYIWWKLCEILE